MLGIDEILGAKASTDIGSGKPHLRRPHAEREGCSIPIKMEALARYINAVAPALGIPHPDRAARLNRIGNDPMIVEP
jgi:hypothetical protein